MRITSLEIKQHDFEKSFRGYAIDEVNSFLESLAVEWDKLNTETKMLRMQLEIAEKETSKLREVEMTLIKTLRSAEDTSNRITQTANELANKKIAELELQLADKMNTANKQSEEIVLNAKYQADRVIQDANISAQQILREANHQAMTIKEDAEMKSKSIHLIAKQEFAALENNFNALEAKRNSIKEELRRIIAGGQEILAEPHTLDFNIEKPAILGNNNESKDLIEPAAPIRTELNDNNSNELLVAKAMPEETPSEEMSFSSAVNELSPKTYDEKSDLEIIEGIGPKIKTVLHNGGILTFRDLATTPLYRIKDLLEAASPHFAIHDPSTWPEQAKLAEEGKFEELENLKKYLIAGRKPSEEVAAAAEKANAVEPADEMLDKVNMVKAALRKSIQDKPDEPAAIPEPKSVSEYIKQNGSFFDNL